jgi:hypothetical protein
MVHTPFRLTLATAAVAGASLPDQNLGPANLAADSALHVRLRVSGSY